MKYDEESELYAALSVDERLKEFDDMLDSRASFKEIWDGREYTSMLHWFLHMQTDIDSIRRWGFSFRAGTR